MGGVVLENGHVVTEGEYLDILERRLDGLVRQVLHARSYASSAPDHPAVKAMDGALAAGLKLADEV